MASAALEKSLDEIIGEKPSNARGRNNPRSSRGTRKDSRPTPYARDDRDDRHERDNPSGRGYRSPRYRSPDGGRRWAHDRYDEDGRRPYRNDDYDRRYQPQREGRDDRATRLKVSNIHYDLAEDEVRDLFERIAPVSRFNMRFDRAGRSEGIAFVTYDRYGDAKLAIQEYDGQSALGQLLEVELDSVVPPPRSSAGRDLASRISGEPRGRRDDGPRRGGSRGGRGQPRSEKASTARRGPVTADDLDAELDNYINQRNNGDSQKVAEAGAGTENAADGGLDGMQID